MLRIVNKVLAIFKRKSLLGEMVKGLEVKIEFGVREVCFDR